MNIKQNVLHKQPRQQILKPGQKVYLYGDRHYEERLIRPLEKTYPQKWTVQLEIGGYAVANVAEIFSIESPQLELKEPEIPFSEEPEIGKISQLEQKIKNPRKYHSTIRNRKPINRAKISRSRTRKPAIEKGLRTS